VFPSQYSKLVFFTSS